MYNDIGALAELRLDARQNSPESLGEVAKQFESLFVQMMVKSMRDATLKGGLLESNSLDTYEQMYDQQLSLELAKHGGVGLAEVIVRQFEGQVQSNALRPEVFNELPTHRIATLTAPISEDNAISGAVPARAPSAVPASVNRSGGASEAAPVSLGEKPADWSAKSQADFVQSLRPHARAASETLGVDPDVLLAQAALETGWGQKVLSRGEGSSNNFFNIKAGSDWQGASVVRSTVEYRDGVAVRENARFRAYPSAAASFRDYAALVSASPRYAAALDAAPDGDAYIRELASAGYATDPRYADKVLAVRAGLGSGRENLALKISANMPIK